ncbi:MAG TPA: hypothetical protein VF194_13570 [Ferrovibrio sp.]|uniref:hypothetical protein n=1 Tax=Ferrovibrio sp. TaxID=1917215 RepID=UPI002ED69F38
MQFPRSASLCFALYLAQAGPQLPALATAQPVWQPFPATEAYLVLAVPGLAAWPTMAAELKGGQPGIRNFRYLWGQPLAAGSFADVIVSQVEQTGKYFAAPPDYPQKLLQAFAYLAPRRPAFGEAETVVSAPLGMINVRPLSLTGRRCIGFGGIFGVVPGSTTFAGGTAPQGDKWIYGLYCPPAGQVLTPEGMRYIIEGFGWKGIALAAPGRPRPATIMAPG